MLKLWILVSLAVPIALFEGTTLFKAGKRRELSTLGALLAVALLIGVAKALGMPTPIELMDRWLRPVGEALFGRL